MINPVKAVKERITGKEKNQEEKSLVSLEFISKVMPLGGLDFSHERFAQTGTGYEACIYVYGYPKNVTTHWLNLICSMEDTICTFDIATADQAMARLAIKKSMEEVTARYNTAKSNSEAIDAKRQFDEIREMYEEVSSYGQIMKTLISRIYVSAPVAYELDLKVKEIIKTLESSGFKAAVPLNETKSGFRNLFLSYSQQQGDIFARKGQSILATTIAHGNPFHFSCLSDPFGSYFGRTLTGGCVMLDIFRKTNVRMSYDFLCVGKKGAGKSTALKKILKDRAIRGDIIRVFDIDGEYTQLVEALGGRVIYLDGQTRTAGGKEQSSIINILQILPNNAEDDGQGKREAENLAFSNHINKVAAIYRYLRSGTAEEEEILALKQLLRVLYMQFEICDRNGELVRDLRVMKPEDFPILSDFAELTRVCVEVFDVIESYQKSGDPDYKEKITETIKFAELLNIRVSKKDSLDMILMKLTDLCTTHRKIFDGYTSIENFYDTPVVCFNLKNLTAKEAEVYDAQLYNALSMCWDNCLDRGIRMKKLFDSGRIASEDIVHSLILVDEAHKSINANKTAGLEFVDRMVREARKYFGALGLASQSIRDFVPDNAGSDAVEKMKNIFEMTTYKFIMQQDTNAVPKLREIFQGSFSESEYEAIPTLEQGNCILAISADRNLQFKIHVSEEEKKLFAGGM